MEPSPRAGSTRTGRPWCSPVSVAAAAAVGRVVVKVVAWVVVKVAAARVVAWAVVKVAAARVVAWVVVKVVAERVALQVATAAETAAGQSFVADFF